MKALKPSILTIGKWDAFLRWLHTKALDRVEVESLETMLSLLMRLSQNNVEIVESLVPIISRKTWIFPFWWLYKRVMIGKRHYAHYLSASEVVDLLNAFREGVDATYSNHTKRVMAHRLRSPERNEKVARLNLDNNVIRTSMIPLMKELVSTHHAVVTVLTDTGRTAFIQRLTTKAAEDILLSEALFYSALNSHSSYIESELMK